MYGVNGSPYKHEDYEEGDMYFCLADKASFFVITLEECICKNANTPNVMKYNIGVLFSLFEKLDKFFVVYDEDCISYEICPLFDAEQCRIKLRCLKRYFNTTISDVVRTLFRLCCACGYNMPDDFLKTVSVVGGANLNEIPKIKKAKEESTIKDYLLVEDKEALLKKMHKYLDVHSRKGKAAALLVNVCMELGLTERIPYSAMKKEFFDIGNKAGYNNQLNNQFSDKEKQPIKEFLKD